jgi:predicted Zn-dependent protease
MIQSTRKPAKKGRAVARRKSGAAVAGLHLLSDAEMRRIAEKIFKLSDADETEVEIGVVSDALTRFANNTIHQNVAEQVLTVSVRTVLDGRTARVTTNKTDDESLRRAVAASAALARSQPRIPDLLPMPGPQKYAKVSRYFENTAHATPADRARAIARVADMAEKNKQTAAGIFTTGVTQSALINTKGLFASHRQTRAEFSITILESDSSGWAKANAPDLGRIDPTALARSASEKSAASRKPSEAPPGKWTVILEPAAVLDLVGFFFMILRGRRWRTSARASTSAWARKSWAATSRSTTMCFIRCNRERRSTVKGFRGRKSYWSIRACQAISSMRAPPQKK